MDVNYYKLSSRSLDLIQPAVGDAGLAVPTGVGFDIQNRGAVSHVHPLDVKDVSFDRKESDNGQGNRIDSMRRAGGKKPPGWRYRFPERTELQFIARGRFVKLPQDVEVGKPLEILEAVGKFRIDFYDSFGIPGMYYVAGLHERGVG